MMQVQILSFGSPVIASPVKERWTSARDKNVALPHSSTKHLDRDLVDISITRNVEVKPAILHILLRQFGAHAAGQFFRRQLGLSDKTLHTDFVEFYELHGFILVLQR